MNELDWIRHSAMLDRRLAESRAEILNLVSPTYAAYAKECHRLSQFCVDRREQADQFTGQARVWWTYMREHARLQMLLRGGQISEQTFRAACTVARRERDLAYMEANATTWQTAAPVKRVAPEVVNTGDLPAGDTPLTMKALSLWEPWATMIRDGHKRYETRSWSTAYRGLLAIHASKRWKFDQEIAITKLAARHPRLQDYLHHKWPLGRVVAICNLKAVYQTDVMLPYLTDLERDLGDFSPGRYAWEMEIVTILEDGFPVAGKQGLWDWTVEYATA